MPITNPYGLEDRIAREVERLRPIIARQKAAILGPSPGSRNVTGQAEVDMWNDRDPNVDVMAKAAEFMAQGHPLPKAQAGATLLAYPNRQEMMENYAGMKTGNINDPDAQDEYARRMQRETMKRQQQQMDEQQMQPMMEGATDGVSRPQSY